MASSFYQIERASLGRSKVLARWSSIKILTSQCQAQGFNQVAMAPAVSGLVVKLGQFLKQSLLWQGPGHRCTQTLSTVTGGLPWFPYPSKIGPDRFHLYHWWWALLPFWTWESRSRGRPHSLQTIMFWDVICLSVCVYMGVGVGCTSQLTHVEVRRQFCGVHFLLPRESRDWTQRARLAKQMPLSAESSLQSLRYYLKADSQIHTDLLLKAVVKII